MNYVNGLFDFIEQSPSVYHAVRSVEKRLLSEGYNELRGTPVPGGKYFVKRGGSSIIAFRYRGGEVGFSICASHGDSPTLRVKQNGQKNNAYARLDVERYGGMIYYSWLDRPLSVAGRVVLECEGGVRTELVNIDCDLATIPSLAIHMNRKVNDGLTINPAVDMLPVYGIGECDGVNKLVADALGVSPESVISHDLFLYVRERGRVIGEDGKLILCPRLDDLECVYASLEAFLNASECDSVPVLAVFDNEEVGSETKQGAASSFLSDVLRSVAGSEAEYLEMLKNSFMVSADNAHAIHPNHPEMADRENAPVVGGGIAVKFNASQKYTTDGVSHAVFDLLCRRAGARVQTYYNRADLPGGSTLGSISNTRVSVSTVDIGLPQLAMHSAVETAGASDLTDMVKALTELYSTAFISEGGSVELKKK